MRSVEKTIVLEARFVQLLTRNVLPTKIANIQDERKCIRRKQVVQTGFENASDTILYLSYSQLT